MFDLPLAVRVGVLVLAAVVGVVAYREAAKFRADAGRSPWDVAPWSWALLGIGSLLIGLALVFIARSTTKPLQPGQPAPRSSGPTLLVFIISMPLILTLLTRFAPL